MSDLVAIVYPSEAKAEQFRQRSLELQRKHLITVGDAVIAVKTDKDFRQAQPARQHDHITAVDRRTLSKDLLLGTFLAAGGVAALGDTVWASGADHCHQQP
jgi:uncharacterized membrane protein